MSEGERESRSRPKPHISNLLNVVSPQFSKRSGLDKAVHQLERAMKSSKNDNVPQEEQRRLQFLLSEAENLVSGSTGKISTQLMEQPSPQNGMNRELSEATDLSSSRAHESIVQMEMGNAALDDAENPLQLLARASDLADTATKQLHMPPPFVETGDLRRFFGSFQPRLDVGSDIDPIDIGLVTHEEVTLLIK